MRVFDCLGRMSVTLLYDVLALLIRYGREWQPAVCAGGYTQHCMGYSVNASDYWRQEEIMVYARSVALVTLCLVPTVVYQLPAVHYFYCRCVSCTRVIPRELGGLLSSHLRPAHMSGAYALLLLLLLSPVSARACCRACVCRADGGLFPSSVPTGIGFVLRSTRYCGGSACVPQLSVLFASVSRGRRGEGVGCIQLYLQKKLSHPRTA